MKNLITLKLLTDVDFMNTPPEDIDWVLRIDGNPFPCNSECVFNYETAIRMIGLFQSIQGTTEDD